MSGMNSLIPRLINTLVSPRVGMIPKVWQRAVYRHGAGPQPGLEGGMPSWVYAEFSLAAQETQDTTFPLPAGFNLLSFAALSFAADNSAQHFRVQMYDVNGQIDFIPGKAVDHSLISGSLGKMFFLTEPYFFRGAEPQLQLRISNLALVAVTTQFTLYGIQGVIQ